MRESSTERDLAGVEVGKAHGASAKACGFITYEL